MTDSEAVALLRPLDQVSVLRIPHARGLLCGIDDAAERSRFNSDAARLLRVPPWGARNPNPNPNPNPKTPRPIPTVTLT